MTTTAGSFAQHHHDGVVETVPHAPDESHATFRDDSAPGTGDGERGAVTAEFAIALPAVVVALLLVLTVLAVGVSTLQCTNAARAAARAAALGEDKADVERIGQDAASESATVAVSHDGDWVDVTVSRPVRLGFFDGPWQVQAHLATPAEPAQAP